MTIMPGEHSEPVLTKSTPHMQVYPNTRQYTVLVRLCVLLCITMYISILITYKCIDWYDCGVWNIYLGKWGMVEIVPHTQRIDNPGVLDWRGDTGAHTGHRARA